MMVLLPGSALPATASLETSPQKFLTIQQAVDMALANSKSLKLNDYSIESAEISLDKASDKMGGFTPSGAQDEEVIQAFTSLMSANINWSMARKTKDVSEDKLVYTVFKDYTAVLQAVEGLDCAKQTLTNAQWQIMVDRLSHQVGITSAYQLEQDELQYKSAQNAYTAAQIGLENSYHSLNETIGLQPGDRPIMVEQPAYSKLVVDNVEAYAHRITEASPSIWLADQNIDIAKMQMDLSSVTNTSGSAYRSNEIAIDKAEISASSARDSMEQAIRTLYNSIISLEESYTLQQSALQNAESAHVVSKLKYALGMANKAELQAAELNVANAKKSLNSTVYQHEQLKLAFEKPWAY